MTSSPVTLPYRIFIDRGEDLSVWNNQFCWGGHYVALKALGAWCCFAAEVCWCYGGASELERMIRSFFLMLKDEDEEDDDEYDDYHHDDHHQLLPTYDSNQWTNVD